MTIIFSGASIRLIAMTVDSVVTDDFGDFQEYHEGQKAYSFPGVGCVATWGERTGNKIGRFLSEQKISPSTHTVNDLAELVFEYLTTDYQPHKDNLGNVGYHIAGFDRNYNPRLYHVFWGIDLPSPPGAQPGYKKYDHSPQLPIYNHLLYNGRNDLADVVVQTLIHQQMVMGNVTRFNLDDPIELALFGDFVARFAAEITPEVGPPFYTFLVSCKNQIEVVENKRFCPLDKNEVVEKLENLGYKTR